MIGFITTAVPETSHKARANQRRGTGSELSGSSARSGIKLAHSCASGLATVFGRLSFPTRDVSTQYSGTTETHRRICNCGECGRISSIDIRVGVCVDCFESEVGR